MDGKSVDSMDGKKNVTWPKGDTVFNFSTLNYEEASAPCRLEGVEEPRPAAWVFDSESSGSSSASQPARLKKVANELIGYFTRCVQNLV